MQEFTEEQLLALEQQLSCPSGDLGLEVADRMNNTNIGMTLSSIDFLKLEDSNRVLELGHAACGHLEQLLSRADGVEYCGLEISESMWQAAVKRYGERANFQLYDGVRIPFEDNSFDRVMSVNTIYFWSKPTELIQEIERVLKPGGFCVLAYADKSFMQDLPFVRDKFQLYGAQEIKQLVADSSMELVAIKNESEKVKSKTDQAVNRLYAMAKMRKLEA